MNARMLEHSVAGGLAYAELIRSACARMTPLEVLLLYLWLEGHSINQLSRDYSFGYSRSALSARLRQAKRILMDTVRQADREEQTHVPT